MSNAISLKANEFDAKIKENSGVCLIDFWADWCGPCRMLAPVVDEIASDFAGKAEVYKVNVDEEGEIAMKFGIMSIPTLIVFKGGEVFDKIIGVVPKEKIASVLESALG